MFFKRRELAKAYRELFSSPNGKIVLEDILTQCRILSHKNEESDINRAKAEALRAFGFRVLRKASLSESLICEELQKKMEAAMDKFPAIEREFPQPPEARASTDNPDSDELGDLTKFPM